MQQAAKNAAVIESPWMTKRQAAKYTHRSERSLDRDKAIPRHKIGGRILFHRAEVDAAILALSAT